MIGLFGGTFNPVHYGHLLICEGMQEEFNLKKVVFIPAKVPPHKDKGEIVKADHRLKMVKLATEDNPHFEVSDIEMKREGYSYTVDTLRLFNNIYPNDDIGLIVGADSLVNFDTWREYQKIFELANILVSSRPDIDNSILDSTILRFKNQFGAKIFKYSTRVMDYSSTEIRRRIARGLSIKYLVPQIVEEYMYKNRLYNVNSTEGIYGN